MIKTVVQKTTVFIIMMHYIPRSRRQGGARWGTQHFIPLVGAGPPGQVFKFSCMAAHHISSRFIKTGFQEILFLHRLFRLGFRDADGQNQFLFRFLGMHIRMDAPLLHHVDVVLDGIEEQAHIFQEKCPPFRLFL